MHGITINETATGARTIRQASLAVIGLIATATAEAGAATAALNAAFPLNTPVLVTDVDAAAGNAGTGGTLKAALEAIGDQTSPIAVVVRVAEGEDQEETDANVIGVTDGNSYTGIQALLAAQSVLGVRPRILGAPGLDTQEVTAELVVAAKKLRAMVYAAAIGDDVAEVITYRDNFGDRELMLIWPDTSADTPGDAVARALGLRAMIDEQQGWHKTLSNVTIGGVTRLTKDVHFDLQDESTPAGLLNAAHVTTLIRNEGFRFWGNRTCASEQQPEFSFESAVRTSHALQDMIVSALGPFMDQPMTVGLIKDLLETVNAQLRQLTVEGRIIGALAYYDPSKNGPTQLAAGRPTISLKYTPAAPLENPIIELINTAEYYEGFAEQLA
ncbi:phage tail sheath protein FI [Sphingobium sp. JAI105]|uniref:phage tail sheath subtilisin-like domain-containing protein n=1 Tax=Sphingobium sp. JAI105 TaxID=2787715 RepID=UPI0018CBA1CD|nr:phage tail sheath subtilisin-like domain-containing protein [Sphingobium sp. JAI105]MBG6118780.1 phage tail sheath protein FI [Sphingobium sp. JAI105]